MSTLVTYYPHAIYLGNSITISQLKDMVAGNNFIDLTSFSASQPVPQFTGNHRAAPDNRVTTEQIKQILDTCTAYNVARDLSAGNVDVEYKAGVNLAVRAADNASSHIRARATSNTMLCWETLTLKQDQTAEIRFRLVHIFKTSTGVDPLVFTSGVAIAQASVVGPLFTLGGVKLNGSFLSGVDEVVWNNNIKYEEIASDGDAFLTYCGVKEYNPVVTIRSWSVDLMASMGTKGTALSSLSVFARKKLISQINVPDATAEHLALTATDGTIKPMAASSSKAMSELEIHLHTGTQNTSPFSYNSATAIS